MQFDRLKQELHPWLSEFRWFRRWVGGRWECWVMDWPFTGTKWFLREPFNPVSPENMRPCDLCRGTPTVEDYRKK